MGQWSKLSAQEKAQIIKFAIKNGVSDINSIRDTYNVYAKDSLANVDYNMAAAKAAGFGSNGNGHYPDTFKKPNHPTFSDESIYHSEETPGGKWRGNTYEPSDFVLNQQGSWNNFLKGFYNQEQGTGAVPVFRGGVMLPEVEVRGHRFEGGGHQYGLGSFIRGVVSKVNEKVPSIAPYTNAVLRRVGLYDPNEGQTEHVLNLTGKKMARVTKDTPNVESVLGNEFIEVSNPNTVQTVAEFKRMSPDTFLGDRHNKQLKNFSIFYGINPKTQTFNIGPLDSLPDDLTVIPVRNKGAAIVDSIAPGSQITEKRRKALRKELRRNNDDFIEGLSNYNIEALKDLRSDLGIENYTEYKDKWYAGFLSPRGVLVSPFKLYKGELRGTQEYQDALKDIKEGAKKRISDDIESGKFDYNSATKEHMRKIVEDLKNPGFMNLSRAYLDYELDWNDLDDKTKRILALEMPGRSVSAFSSYKDSVQSLKNKHVHFVDSVNKIINDVPRYINKTTGEEIPFASKRDMGAKQYLISPDGAALFLHGYNNAPEDVEAINSFLSKHPAYPVLVDNGRYSHYQIGNGNVEKYISEGRVGGFPDEKMYIQGVVKKDGGPIHIAPSKKGTFTAAATKHGKSVQEFARQVLANPENYSSAMRRKANFARNASKWHNHEDGGEIGTNNNRPQDQPQISWIENWLNSRKDVMAKNIADTEFGNHVIVYSPKNNTGDVRDAGFNVDYNYPIYNPLYWFLGQNPRIKQAEKIINREVQNIKNVPVTNVGNEYKPSYGMLGVYVTPSHFDNSGNYVAFLGTPKDEVKIHEFTHASNPTPQEYYIEQVLYKDANIPKSVPGNNKHTQAKELYAALQEVRYKSGLKPNVVVDEQWLENNKKYFKNTYLEGLPNNILIRLFNELAQNGSPLKKSDNSYLAALGGSLSRNAAHWGAEGLRLDDEYNTNQYNQQLDRFTGLGFKGQQASDLAAYEAGKNLQYDAGQLPFEVVATPAKKHVIFDNGIKNVHYAPHTAPVQESVESKIAAGAIGAPLLATAGTSIAAPAIPKIVNLLNSPIMQAIDAELTIGDMLSLGLDASYYYKYKDLWNEAGYKNYFDYRYDKPNSPADYLPMAFDLLSATSAFRLGKDIHKGVQLYKNSPKIFEDARDFVKQMHLEDFDAAGKGVTERYTEPFVPYSKRTPESLRSGLLNSLDNITYEKTLNPFKYSDVHFKNLKDALSLSNWKKLNNGLLSTSTAYFQPADNVVRVNPKTFVRGLIRGNTNMEKNLGATLAHEVEHGVFRNLEYPSEAYKFIRRWGKNDDIGVGYDWYKSLNEFNSRIAERKYELGKKHYKDFTKREKEKFINSLQNEFFDDPNKADQLLFMMHKHLSTGGPLYPFSFQKNPYLKVPVVRYDEGGKKTEGSVARNFGSHKGANGLYLDTDTNTRTYDGGGLTPVSVFFNQEYPKGMNITDFDKQQQLFNWYESERQRMGNAFSVEDASKWAHNIATQHIYPEFILPTMTVVASKNKKKGNELQEKYLTQNVESPIIESAPIIESNFVVGNGPKWEDSFRERQLGKGFDTYGRMLSDTVPAINVPELVRMSEDWYNKITDTYPEITEEEVLDALNDMKYVRAGAYTGPAGMMHSGHWAWFDPYTNTLTSSGGSTDAHELEHALREKVLGNSGKATDEEKKILKTMFPTLNTKTHYTFGNHDVSEMLALNNEVREALRTKLGYSTTKDLIKGLSDNTKITDNQLAEILEETLESSAYIPTTEDVYRSITRKEAPMKDFQYWVNEFYDPDFIKYYDISKDGKIDDIEHIDSSNKGYLQHPFYESIFSIIPTLYDENTANTLLEDLKSKQKSYKEQFIQSNGEEKVYTKPYFKALEEIKLKWYNEHIEDILKDFIKKSENYKKPSYNINKQQQEKIDAARKALKIIAGIEPNTQQNIV